MLSAIKPQKLCLIHSSWNDRAHTNSLLHIQSVGVPGKLCALLLGTPFGIYGQSDIYVDILVLLRTKIRMRTYVNTSCLRKQYTFWFKQSIYSSETVLENSTRSRRTQCTIMAKRFRVMAVFLIEIKTMIKIADRASVIVHSHRKKRCSAT